LSWQWFLLAIMLPAGTVNLLASSKRSHLTLAAPRHFGPVK